MELIQTAGFQTKPTQSQTCVLYNPDTGEVEHIHSVITLQGATARSQRQIEAEAMILAQKSGNKLARTKTLFVKEIPKLRPERSFKVDLTKLTLIESD